jgi:hypothetical protein
LVSQFTFTLLNQYMQADTFQSLYPSFSSFLRCPSSASAWAKFAIELFFCLHVVSALQGANIDRRTTDIPVKAIIVEHTETGMSKALHNHYGSLVRLEGACCPSEANCVVSAMVVLGENSCVRQYMDRMKARQRVLKPGWSEGRSTMVRSGSYLESIWNWQTIRNIPLDDE